MYQEKTPTPPHTYVSRRHTPSYVCAKTTYTPPPSCMHQDDMHPSPTCIHQDDIHPSVRTKTTYTLPAPRRHTPLTPLVCTKTTYTPSSTFMHKDDIIPLTPHLCIKTTYTPPSTLNFMHKDDIIPLTPLVCTKMTYTPHPTCMHQDDIYPSPHMYAPRWQTPFYTHTSRHHLPSPSSHTQGQLSGWLVFLLLWLASGLWWSFTKLLLTCY